MKCTFWGREKPEKTDFGTLSGTGVFVVAEVFGTSIFLYGGVRDLVVFGGPARVLRQPRPPPPNHPLRELVNTGLDGPRVGTNGCIFLFGLWSDSFERTKWNFKTTSAKHVA